MTYILAIDQGTTTSRAIIFDSKMLVVSISQQEFAQHFPNSGWVEHNPQDLWRTTIDTCRQAMVAAQIGAGDVSAIGITNQRETTVVWDRNTGLPIYNAIVWQDRRTADMCLRLKADGMENLIAQQTGLLLDPYFSGTKLKWILENVDGAKRRARNGDLLFGTVDSYLIWHLTDRQIHVTDATNAARTMLYDIHNGNWSNDICSAFDIPLGMLPEVRDCSSDFGTTQSDILGGCISICGVAGDQQAAAVGQACFEPGMAKSTYGTGCFALLIIGETPVISQNRLLTTIAYQLNGKPTYALEGSIFNAGTVVQWLRDGLKIIETAAETQILSTQADQGQSVIFVPAFTGMGAPYWNADCRGAIFGLTRNTGRAEIARAALESIGFQTRDLLEAMQADWNHQGNQATQATLRVDGGMTTNDWAMQFLADITNAPVDRPTILETTAVGAAWLAGQHTGVYGNQSDFSKNWKLDRSFIPAMQSTDRDTRYRSWKQAVTAALTVV
jgi:glycerol kinase